MVKIMLIECSVDKNGEVDTGMRLGALRHRLMEASNAPDDTVIKYGYLPERLTDGFYVEEPVDLKVLHLVALQPLARSRDSAEAKAAWDEIERRIRTGEWRD